jgi:hypothetical protein
MTRGTLWTWIGAAVIGVGLAGNASAEPGDRDHESARMRMQEVQQRVADLEARALARPDYGVSVTGRAIGGDTGAVGDYKHNFKSAADMRAHMTQAVKMRGSEGGAPTDGGTEPVSHGAAATSANNVATLAHVDFMLLKRHTKDLVTEPGDRMMSDHERRVLSVSVTGHPLGQDTAEVGAQYIDKQNQTRAKQLRAAHPNAGRELGNPAQISNTARTTLAQAGFVAPAKKTSSSDVEDKAK